MPEGYLYKLFALIFFIKSILGNEWMIICKLKNNTDENHICFCFCTNLYLHMYILNVHWAFFKACNSKMKNNVISDSTVSISVNKS